MALGLWTSLGVCATPARAAEGPSDRARSRHAEVRLVSEVASIRPGTPFWVGLRIVTEPEWHTYWRNPGDSGLPTRIRWDLPEGFVAGPIEWPYPERAPLGPLMSFGYERAVLLTMRLTPPDGLPEGTARLAARVDWLECREACLPGKAELELTRPVRGSEPLPDPEAEPWFEQARAEWPVPAQGWTVSAHVATNAVALALEPPAGVAIADAYFYPFATEVLDYSVPAKLFRTASGYRLDMTRAANAAPLESLAGVLVARHDGQTLAVELDAPASPDAAPEALGEVAATPVPSPGGPGLALALVFAFVGGLILNLMPCVLPVLSLKVLGFIRQAGEGRRAAWHHGLAFTAGVVGFFWLLAGVLLALRAGGEQIGWGFQLQSPPFVAFLACLFLVLGLNMFGLFEVGESLTAAGGLTVGKAGLAASFWSGALATVVATPCTAPFMGSALGFALGQPAWVTLAVFSGLGLGMASPYLVLARFPGLLRFLPRPGAWMVAFKQLMGFLLLGTVVALLWLFGRQVGVDAMSLLLAGLLFLGLAAWVYGSGTAPDASPRRRRISIMLAVVLAALGLGLGFARAQPQAPHASGAAAAEQGIAWEPWSEARLAELRAAGTPVFVDFTADWCLSCQVNERVTFSSREVQERFRSAGIVALRADWTLQDDAITRALAAHGRQGVPTYVLYGRGGKPPRLLPELITPSIVLDAIDQDL